MMENKQRGLVAQRNEEDLAVRTERNEEEEDGEYKSSTNYRVTILFSRDGSGGSREKWFAIAKINILQQTVANMWVKSTNYIWDE